VALIQSRACNARAQVGAGADARRALIAGSSGDAVVARRAVSERRIVADASGRVAGASAVALIQRRTGNAGTEVGTGAYARRALVACGSGNAVAARRAVA